MTEEDRQKQALPKHIKIGYYIRYDKWEALVKSVNHAVLPLDTNPTERKDTWRIEIRYEIGNGLVVTGTFNHEDLKPIQRVLPTVLQPGKWLNVKGVKHQVTEAYPMRSANDRAAFFVFESRILRHGRTIPTMHPAMRFDPIRMTRMGPSEVKSQASIIAVFDKEAAGRGGHDHRNKAEIRRSHLRFIFR